jgi:phage N-6-adenine-methyltransferase
VSKECIGPNPPTPHEPPVLTLTTCPSAPSERKKKAKQHNGDGEQCWETPWHIVRAIENDTHNGFAFHLDVAASVQNHKADRFIALPMNGLVEPWSPRNWCNPPYADQESWLKRAAYFAREYGYTTSCLVLASTSALYWRDVVVPNATVDYYRGRIAFLDTVTQQPIDNNSYANAVVHFGPRFMGHTTRWRDAETGLLIEDVEAPDLFANGGGR